MNVNVILANLLSGGFLKGKRTALLAGALVIDLIVRYLVGDIGAVDFLQQAWTQIAIALGLVTAAASGNDANPKP